ncbi:MAG: helix-turn-helix domain-containing protein [Acidobacteriota bacterium]
MALKTRLERYKAFSTGQVARFCFVTPETILNWIRANQIKAQRTAGGQYRIRLEDLRTFMLERGMETALLDEEKDVRPFCWEFHCQGSLQGEACDTCLIHRSGALNCWQLHGLLPLTARRFRDCEECDYYQRFAHESSSGEECDET